jgi:hypothetical protein
MKEGVVLKVYDKSEKIKYLPIRKKDLADLTDLMVDNDSSDKYFSISTTIDSLSIQERSIEAFLVHKEVPDRLFEYKILSIKSDLNHETEKSIIIYMHNQYSSDLAVSGSDETWVQGKFQQINDFINRKLVQYEQEQKSIEKDKIVVVEDKSRKIQEQYAKKEKGKFFPVSKKDLRDITDLIMKNDFSDEDLSISTQIDTLSIKGRSIEAFLAHGEVPDPLREFSITFIKSNLSNEIEKVVIFYIFDNLSTHLDVSGLDKTWVLGKFQQIKEFINRKLEQYEEEQKRMENEKAMAISHKDKEIVISKTILQRLEHTSPLEKIVAIFVILGAIAAIIAIIPTIQTWFH